ncbi:MAG: DoxX family membrane protein [Armatimonadetes bacterium]|nr:DoxX family membrane protein [Armatimonadota bacterium]
MTEPVETPSTDSHGSRRPDRIKRKWTVYLATIARIVVGALFLLASYDKILDPLRFAESVDSYKLLPAVAISPFALALPWIEFVAGLLLVLGMASRAAALVVLCLLLMFMGAIGIDMARGLTIDCGCFGALTESDPIGWVTLVRDVGLTVMTLYVMLFDEQTFGLEALLNREERKSRDTSNRNGTVVP